MIIGVPKEVKTLENRVAMTPAGVEALIGRGHKVIVEENAGIGSGLENQPAGQLKLVTIEAKSNLTKEGNGLYKLTGGGIAKEGAKNISVRQGFLELSNVNSVEEMTKMITTLRAFEAYQKVIQAIDGADDLAVNSIGRIA